MVIHMASFVKFIKLPRNIAAYNCCHFGPFNYFKFVSYFIHGSPMEFNQFLVRFFKIMHIFLFLTSEVTARATTFGRLQVFLHSLTLFLRISGNFIFSIISTFRRDTFHVLPVIFVNLIIFIQKS